MSPSHSSRLLQKVKQEDGQTLPFLTLITILFLGISSLTLDLGRAFFAYRELQSSTDAAALAGAYALSLSTATTATVRTAVQNSSSYTGAANVSSNLPGAAVTTTFKCLNALINEGIQCSASPTGYNAIQVQQTSSVPVYFVHALRLFGVSTATSLSISSTATAAMKGAVNAQYNVAVVLDTTASMGQQDNDASCNNTRIACALSGTQTLLQSLSPCSGSGSSCSAFDSVSLFTFPNVEADTAQKDYTCPTSNPTIMPYSTPTPGATWSAPTGKAATYQITSYLTDYSSTNKAGGALSTSSALSIASGASTTRNCSGLQTPGGQGTYYAGAIYAALSSLAARQALNPGSLNALIILSDGDASASNISGSLTSSGKYPSLKDQCQQGIDAAQSAPSGTTVYAIAYGASSSGCSTDTTRTLHGLSPCTAMQMMASAPEDFYSDATASQNAGQCTSSSNPNLTLSNIFKQVALKFTVARLIPNSTT